MALQTLRAVVGYLIIARARAREKEKSCVQTLGLCLHPGSSTTSSNRHCIDRIATARDARNKTYSSTIIRVYGAKYRWNTQHTYCILEAKTARTTVGPNDLFCQYNTPKRVTRASATLCVSQRPIMPSPTASEAMGQSRE